MFRHFWAYEAHQGRARLFEKGDLKYVILESIKDKPAHGYEIIRALEERFHGFYSPSAGSIYPTLQLLEDMGYVKSSEQDGKKVYTITDEGRQFLAGREETVAKIRGRMREWWGSQAHSEFRDTLHELRDVAFLVGRNARKLDADKIGKIKEIMHKACQDIENIVEPEKK